MSRHLIAYEGRDTKDGRRVQPGALHWDRDTFLPVIDSWDSADAHSAGQRVAAIVKIERDGDELWAEVEPDGVVRTGQCLSLDTDLCDIVMEGDTLVFTSARIRGAHLLPLERWMWIT